MTQYPDVESEPQLRSLISNVYLIIVIRLHDQIHTGGQCRSFSFSVRRNLTQYIGTTVLPPRATVALIVLPRLLKITYHQLSVFNLSFTCTVLEYVR
jgi:hypothetical protein